MSPAAGKQMVRFGAFLQQRILQLVDCGRDCRCVVMYDEHTCSVLIQYSELCFVITPQGSHRVELFRAERAVVSDEEFCYFCKVFLWLVLFL